MTTIEAARDIRDQLKAQEAPAPWSECLRWAAQCHRDLQAFEDRQRQAFMVRRKEELRGERFRQLLAKANQTLEGARGIEGRVDRLPIQFCPTSPQADPNFTSIRPRRLA